MRVQVNQVRGVGQVLEAQLAVAVGSNEAEVHCAVQPHMTAIEGKAALHGAEISGQRNRKVRLGKQAHLGIVELDEEIFGRWRTALGEVRQVEAEREIEEQPECRVDLR